MQPPPGSVPHPFGQGVVVAVPVQSWRSKVLLGGAVLLAVLYSLLLVLLVFGVQRVPYLSPFLLLAPLATVHLQLLFGQAVVARGPALVVDDVGIRLRDVVGWIQVPWARLRSMTVTSRGRVLRLDAPGGVYLNEMLIRRSFQAYRIDTLVVRPDHLVRYLEHRRATAPG
ncbi:PH domain-containing protein [Desertihabitans aurantiacus]|uniref:PH domain-containing protein n=1 Tax=Desertihabitans aurantiacus TaxID=2282477 RepID=UPI001300A1FB|nr:PH domain-containing protein [Desertihabitans aurantiacus]